MEINLEWLASIPVGQIRVRDMGYLYNVPEILEIVYLKWPGFLHSSVHPLLSSHLQLSNLLTVMLIHACWNDLCWCLDRNWLPIETIDSIYESLPKHL